MCRVTRSRSGHKNDNVRAEPKKRHPLRWLVVYDRLGDGRMVWLLNRGYRLCNSCNNYFLPCKRLFSLGIGRAVTSKSVTMHHTHRMQG